MQRQYVRQGRQLSIWLWPRAHASARQVHATTARQVGAGGPTTGSREV